MNGINIDKLTDTVVKELDAFKRSTEEAIKNAAEKTAKTTVQTLKNTSPKRTGTYARSWTSSKDKAVAKHQYGRTVYVKAPHYRLTHLLEFGHASKNGGRVQPKEHIAPAEQKAINDFTKYLKEGIEEAR